MKIPETPELEKRGKQIKALHTQAIGIFLEWAASMGYHLAEWASEGYANDIDDNLSLFPVRKSIEELLAEYAGIDLKKVEQEKRALLEYQRWLNGEREN